ncbi:MAG: hypothetical protein EXR55_06415 [Dehalococcoidia bacterium]|nr:hypothetical protein [Dehalococcoidia bacterium]
MVVGAATLAVDGGVLGRAGGPCGVGDSGPGEPSARPCPLPLDIARERYARGDISREQFEGMRRTLVS